MKFLSQRSITDKKQEKHQENNITIILILQNNYLFKNLP